MGKTPFDFMPPEEAAKVGEIFGQYINSHKPIPSLENAIRHKDGHIVILETSGEPVFNQNGELVGYRGIDRDITDRKKAEAALMHEQATIESILTSLPGMFYMFYMFDQHGRFVRWNKNLETLTGYTEEDIREMTPLDFMAEESKSQIAAAIEKTLSEGSTEVEATVVTKSGIEILFFFSANLKHIDDEPYILGMGLDITERKKTDRELQKLASIVQHSNELIALSTPDGTLIFMNEAGARMLGTTPEEAISHPILYFISEHLKEKVESELLPLWIEQDSWEGDLQYINNSTGKLFDVHTLVFKIKYPATGEVLNLVNVSQDNTNRKRAEKALQEVNKKLNLLSSITRHDIINQVTAAEMFVDIMEMESTAVGRLATLARKSNRSYLLPPQ